DNLSLHDALPICSAVNVNVIGIIVCKAWISAKLYCTARPFNIPLLAYENGLNENTKNNEHTAKNAIGSNIVFGASCKAGVSKLATRNFPKNALKIRRPM